jgi:hypothetical protein
MDDLDNKWRVIVELYKHTKALIILAEENEFDELKTFIQPFLEQRSALDHICRAMSVKIGIQSNTEEYVIQSLDKAIGHLYRAFFDSADWIGIILREKIIQLMQPYTNECITVVAPEYYQRTRPNIEKLNSDFAKLRQSKDIAVNNTIISQIEDYHQKIEELLEEYKNLIPKVPTLEEVTHEQAKKAYRELIIVIVATILGAVLGVIGTIILG